MELGTEDTALFRRYQDLRVEHSAIKPVIERLMRIAAAETPESLVLVVGASGVGKSTAMESLRRRLLQKHHAAMLADPGHLPFVFVQLAAPTSGSFRWTDAFHRTLNEFHEVLISKKVIQLPTYSLDGEQFTNARGFVSDALRRSVEQCVQHRATKLLGFDEAGSFLLVNQRSTPPEFQFEVMKGLAVKLKIPILLFGSYKLLGLLEKPFGIFSAMTRYITRRNIDSKAFIPLQEHKIPVLRQ